MTNFIIFNKILAIFLPNNLDPKNNAFYNTILGDCAHKGVGYRRINMRYDCIIIGSGPAGLSAAINLKIYNKNFLWFGNANLSDKVEKAEQVYQMSQEKNYRLRF